MKLLQNLDLYKVVIVGSLVGLPAVGWWIKRTSDNIEAAQRAVTEATKKGGLLEEIGKLQEQLDIVQKNRRDTSDATGNTDLYFDGQIIRSAKDGNLDKNQYKINPAREEPVQTSSKQAARDHIVKIDWLPRGGKDFSINREFLFAVLFNCESGARGPNVTQVPAIWKLYSLKITNVSLGREASQQQAPPPTTEDEWVIGKMEFARREPAKR